MKQALNVGILFRDISARGSGSVPVALSIIECMRKLNFRTILLCNKKHDRVQLARNLGLRAQPDSEVVLPIWFNPRRAHKIRTYFDFLLPVLAKPLCDITVNPYTNDLLPWVDVTYVNAPRPLLLAQKSRNHNFWNCYYKPYQVIERSLGLRTSDKLVLANSYFMAGVLREQIGVNPLVVYPPVDLRGIRYSKSNEIKRNIVLTIARFSPEKNLEQIPLIARGVGAKFFILGTINSEAVYRRVRRLIKEYGVEDKVSIIVNSPNNHEIKKLLLKKAKVFLHTSLFEPFGISIAEGMGAGCISVVHDSGGPREFVPPLWRYKDTEDATQKIEEALDFWSPSVAKDMESIAYHFRKERFQNIFTRILKTYLAKRESS